MNDEQNYTSVHVTYTQFICDAPLILHLLYAKKKKKEKEIVFLVAHGITK